MSQVNLVCAQADDVCVWSEMKREAASYAVREVALSSLLHATILDQQDLGSALVNHLSEKLASGDFSALKLRKVLAEAIESDPGLVPCIARDLQAVKERDPACHSYLQCFLYFKGFLAIQTHRCAHALYKAGRDLLAYHLQSRSSELFGVDINPAAQIGCGIMLDHATGFVMGETARLGDDCSILQGVTLGGTGKSDQDRHPKIGNRVLIGANASVLGNIEIEDGALIAAGSVVLKPVSKNCTVAGVPAKPVGGSCGDPAASMHQGFKA
ncbi:serine O-acetyltransferase [Algimonas porphyrae]|uniref:Serine acetyltransferase n=1 Tax=Algimonas porphyrae TaxID=1128113 RepID=A0ABQ5UV62_9PROT|nr:serine O-acetyltransferase [Algimonas porphyrae]GLQ19159.1 serine O-acetyltransferase [Algimonas porphyrae]